MEMKVREFGQDEEEEDSSLDESIATAAAWIR